MRIAAVSCHIGVYESMICSIKKCEDKIRGSVNISAPLRGKITVQGIVNPLKKIWLKDETQKWLSVIGAVAMPKVLPVTGALILKNCIKTSLDTT